MALGGVLAGLAVGLGAFAAHGLSDQFATQYAGAEPRKVAGVEIPASLKYLEDFKTGAEYQMYHALGMIGVGLVLRSSEKKNRLLDLAGWSFLVGILVFSGFLYLLTLTGQRWMGGIVPIGGVAFLVGWGCFAAGVCPCRNSECQLPRV
jgi:uncharacterized membrane protein YgdD (TMEM256/DUF423 family)